MFEIEHYKKQRWNIARVGRRVSQQVAIWNVLYPAAGITPDKYALQHVNVVRMIHRLHDLWFRRSKELMVRELWLPTDSVSRQSRLWSCRRVLHCRPSCVFFKYGNTGRIRPCARPKVCPFCWARLASYTYRRFKSQIRRIRLQQDNLIVTCRVLSQHVAATPFTAADGISEKHIADGAARLKDIFEQHRAAYAQAAKQLQRATLGSAYRVVVNPQLDGWRVEARQLFLARAKTRLSAVKFRAGAVVYRESAKVTDDDALELLLGRFLEYPSGLLTGYSELTAAYLTAAHSLRLVNGTGLFRKCGRGLESVFRRDKQDGEDQLQHPAEDESAIRAAFDTGPFGDFV